MDIGGKRHQTGRCCDGWLDVAANEILPNAKASCILMDTVDAETADAEKGGRSYAQGSLKGL